MKKRIVTITAICSLLICGFIAIMEFGNVKNGAASAEMDFLNGRNYYELSSAEKDTLYHKASNVEYERLKKAGKLLITLDPNVNREQPFETATYYANINRIELDLEAYGYMAEIYGDKYLRFSVIDNEKEDIEYMKLMTRYLENGIISGKLDYPEPVWWFVDYIDFRKEKLDKGMIARFGKVYTFYKDCIYERIVNKAREGLRELCDYLMTREHGIPDLTREESRKYAYERINLMLKAFEDSIDKNEIIEKDYASAFFTYMHYTQEVMDEEMLARYRAVYDFYYPIYGSEEQGYGTVDWQPSLMLFIK